MGNFKVRVNNEAESREVQELFFKSGGKWCLGGCKIKNTDEPYLYLENGLVLHGSSAETFNAEQHKEITLPELRAMVNDQYAEIEQVHQAEIHGTVKAKSAWDTQIGGIHYKQFKIQPMQFALENKLDAAQQNVIKYIMRHSFKNGKQDLEKAKHYIDLMIEFYYGDLNHIDS